MSKPINTNDSVELIPSSFDDANSSYASVVSGYATSNGLTNHSSTTAARFNINTGSSAETYIYYNFDTSDIPSGATINSITCQCKASISNTNSNRINTRQAQLCSGTTTKGTAYTIANSTTAFNITAGSWTRSELNNLKIRIYIKRGSSNTTTTYYVAFYGATVTIDYTISGTAYTITASSSVNGITATPATQDILSGEDTEVRIDGTSLDDVAVTDNGIDITDQLVRYAIPSNGSVSKTATDFTTGFSGGSSMNFYTSSSSTGNNFNYAVGHTAESPGSTSSGSGSWTYVKQNNSSTSYTGYADFTFDFSDIPANATITSIEVKCYGAIEDSSQTTSHSDITLYSGSTQKSTTQSFTSSSNSIITISSPGTWTRAELQNAKLRFAVGYYGGHIFGITWNVSYTIPSQGYYWIYALNNLSADHTILIEEAGVYIPPEEDPQYTYQSLTISSINATTNPGTGTTRVIQGSNQTITITPFDPQLTLALDNGVDITSQLQGGLPTNTYTVTTKVSGATYGFNLNTSTGYYVSTNNGVAKSASVARINMNFESSCVVTIQYINYAEANYDYGMFGKLDTAVATDGLTASSGSSSPSDSTSNYQLAMASNNSSAQTITYTVPSGEHFIDIKYGKDDGTDSNNDTLQWKVLSIEATSAGGDYTYTLTNITQKHSLIFVFGNVSYYFITSSGTNCRIFPDGQQVKLEGDNYKINIIPNTITDIVSITDNNIDRTTLLERTDGYDKDNNPAVSYSYSLSNVTATHTLAIVCTAAAAQDILWMKITASSWDIVAQIWAKENDRWVQKPQSYLQDNNIHYLRRIT